MPNSPKMGWPSPEKDQDPYYDTFQSMVTAMDASGYSAREDRGIILSQGGNVAFTASTGSLTWSAGVAILSPIAGFKMTMPAGGVTLLDGQCLYVNVVRSPSGNISLASLVGNQIANSDIAMLLAIRNGTSVYWRNGAAINDGDNRSLFSPSIPPSPGADVTVDLSGSANFPTIVWDASGAGPGGIRFINYPGVVSHIAGLDSTNAPDGRVVYLWADGPSNTLILDVESSSATSTSDRFFAQVSSSLTQAGGIAVRRSAVKDRWILMSPT